MFSISQDKILLVNISFQHDDIAGILADDKVSQSRRRVSHSFSEYHLTEK